MRTPLQTLIERTRPAELEELVAQKAADVARHAEWKGQPGHADVFWKIARQCRVAGMMLRVQDALRERPPALLN